MKRAALFASILAVTLMGCYASKPSNNVEFVTTHALQELAGTYQNLGESKERGHYLSQTIWPKEKALRHDSISAISVRVIGDTALAVQALQGSDVVKEGLFVSGKDFQFTRGRLRLNATSDDTFRNPEAGGLFFSRVTQELGVDTKGQGKLKKRETVVGLAYLVAPIAVTGTTEVRFPRIGEP